jgi:prepilin-type N-terminal cleavage/methylation domain-containing protein
MKFFQQKKYRLITSHPGFTLIELMITITIVVLVTGLIMVQYSSFNNSVLLTDQAYLTAFDIREAQSLAVSVRGQGAQFREEYGLYFNKSAGSNNKYILFQDRGTAVPAQYNYNADPDLDEAVGIPYKVDPRFTITDICGTVGSIETCNKTSVSISFKRPNFDAVFAMPGLNPESVRIQFKPLNGAITRSVVVYKTGQVSVQ